MFRQGLGRRQSVGGDQSVALTSPRPFNLRSEERGKVKQAMLAQRLEEKRKQASGVESEGAIDDDDSTRNEHNTI